MRKIMLACLLVLPGCSWLEFNTGAEKAKEKVVIITDNLERAVPILDAMDDAGVSLSPDTSSKAEAGASMAQKGLGVASGIAALVPGGQGVAALLGALGTLAGGIGTILARKRAAKVTKAAVAAANAVDGGGQALVDASKAQGVADVVHKEYQSQQ